MDKNDLIVVSGAGGFIGGHLISDLRSLGYKKIRAIDIKPLHRWFQRFDNVENLQLNLKEYAAAEIACKDADYVFNLAADMGGMGFITNHKAECMLSVLINTHMLMAANKCKVKRFLFSSSACVYAEGRQTMAEVIPLKEEYAYPAMPEDGYGWEKLFSERMCRHFSEDYQLSTRIIRFHNVYGPYGTYDGGREKSPAALCRKVIRAILNNHHEIEIWGDGEQTRSFMYIDDCLYGIKAIMMSDIQEPINLGSNELVTINQMVDMIEEIAGVKLHRKYKLDAPLGVRGRNSDNTFIKSKLGWEPATSLKTGLQNTYRWIYDQITSAHHEKQCIFS